MIHQLPFEKPDTWPGFTAGRVEFLGIFPVAWESQRLTKAHQWEGW